MVSKSDCHYNLDESIFSEWTENLPNRTIQINNRIIYIFDNL